MGSCFLFLSVLAANLYQTVTFVPDVVAERRDLVLNLDIDLDSTVQCLDLDSTDARTDPRAPILTPAGARNLRPFRSKHQCGLANLCEVKVPPPRFSLILNPDWWDQINLDPDLHVYNLESWSRSLQIVRDAIFLFTSVWRITPQKTIPDWL